MKISFHSRTARRIIFGCLIAGIMFGALSWQRSLKQQRVEEFIRTTTIEDNPWGLEREMDLSQVISTLPEAHFVSNSSSPSGFSSVFMMQHDRVEYRVKIDLERNIKQGSDGLSKLKIVSGTRLVHPWLKWLKTKLGV